MRRAIAVVASAAMLMLPVGCGSGEDSGSADPGGTKPDKVTVGLIAIADVAPIYLGERKGFFRDRGIDLTLRTGSGGAVTIAGVVSGQYQFGFGNITSLLVARDKGLPLTVLANGNSSTGVAGKDFSAVVVRQDSPIRAPRDLAGRSVSVNNLKNIGDTTVRASVRKDGGDANAVKFVEMTLPEMSPALTGGKIDAAWVVEPFLTTALADGHRVVAWNMVDTAPKMTVAAYFSSAQTISKNPDLTRRFKEAINESLAYAAAHTDEAREIIASYTKIPPDVLAKINLPAWGTELNRPSIEQLAGLIEQDGLIRKSADVNALLGA